jgi:hypothetical protein
VKMAMSTPTSQSSGSRMAYCVYVSGSDVFAERMSGDVCRQPCPMLDLPNHRAVT